MPLPSTHQSNRAPGNLPLNLRNSFESETWDDNASVVYEAEDPLIDSIAAGATLAVCSLEVGTPVQARLQVWAQARGITGAGTGIWSAAVRIGGVATDTWTDTIRWPATFGSNVVWIGTIDVEPGLYTLDILITLDGASIGMDFYNKKLIVRRGRKPSSV